MTRTKAPSMQWYPGDWQRDFGVRSCSLAARGLWREMLDVMHDGEPRGTMQVGRKIISDPAEIGAMVGAKPGEDVAAMLAELEAADVFSRNESGAIYSRRMVRDSYISEVRRASGSKGGEVAQAKLRGKTEETPADAVAEEKKAEEKREELPTALDTEAFRAAWELWRQYRVERHLAAWKPLTIRTQLAKLAELGEARAIAAIDHSIAQAYQGIYEPKAQATGGKGFAPIPCARCGGKKYIETPSPNGGWTMYKEPCKRCQGTGVAA